MKTIRALVNFSGKVSMSKGKEREVSDELAKDLIQAGYAEEVVPAKNTRAGKSGVKNETK